MLKKILLFIFLLIFIFFQVSLLFANTTTNDTISISLKNKKQKINWELNYESALSNALTLKKPILIFVYTSWCGWCKKLENETLNSEEIVSLLQNFICFKIDYDETYDKELISKLKINEFPTILFISNNDELERHLGFKTITEFKKIIENFLNKYKFNE